jgi:hypothetical protein
VLNSLSKTGPKILQGKQRQYLLLSQNRKQYLKSCSFESDESMVDCATFNWYSDGNWCSALSLVAMTPTATMASNSTNT